MTDEAVQVIWEQVGLFLRGDTGRGFDVGKPACFAALLDFVRHQGRAILAGVAEDELRLLTAACLLGPDTAGLPPADLRTHLVQLARRFEPSATKRLERAMEFAIAFGCGWQRQLRPGGEAWERCWADAVRALSRALEPAVTQSRLWLRQHVVSYIRTKENDRSDAQMLAMHLLHPLHLEQEETLRFTYRGPDALVEPARRDPISVPSGAKYILTAMEKTQLVGPQRTFSIKAGATLILSVHDTEAHITMNQVSQRLRIQAEETAKTVEAAVFASWACTCGTKQCAERHRLGNWNVHAVSLWAFVASAVKGLPQLRTKAFVQGMLFALLTNMGEETARLRLVSVEYKLCQGCALEYEGDQCPACRLSPDVSTRRRTYPRLVCVGTDLPTYEREERLHCTDPACQNVYQLPQEWEGWAQVRQAKEWQKYPGRLPASMQGQPIDVGKLQQAISTRLAALHCPLCNSSAPRRVTIVWVRQFGHRAELDASDLNSDSEGG